jgi:hypothetical protein
MSMKKLVLFALIVAGIAVSASVALGFALSNARRDASIAQANADAYRDTMQTHRSELDTINEAVSLMIVQDSVNTDSILRLGGALAAAVEDRDQHLRSLQIVRVEFDKLRTSIESTEVVQDDPEPETGEVSQTGTFALEGPPIDGSVSVTAWLHDLTRPWSLKTDLTVRPFVSTYAIGCDDLRRAIFNVESPSWVRMELVQGVVEPEVCHGRKVSLFDFSWGKATWFAGGVGAGVLLWNLVDDGFRSARY